MIRLITFESLDLIKHFEGFSESPYFDEKGVATIGIGTIKYPPFYMQGKDVEIHDPKIDKDKADRFLVYELSQKADEVNWFLRKNACLLSDQQYSALVSFAYNCGTGPIVQSGRSVCEAIKKDSIPEIADSFLLYDKIIKKVLGFPIKKTLAGLTRRRKAERYLFLNGKNNFFN